MLVAGATMLGAQPEQAGTSGFRLSSSRARGRGRCTIRRRDYHIGQVDRAVPPARREPRSPARECRAAGLALYNPLTDNWGELILVAGHPAPGKLNEEAGASWDRVSANYLQNFGMPILARARLHRRRQRNSATGGHRERSFRETIFQEQMKIRSISISVWICRRMPGHVSHCRRCAATRNLRAFNSTSPARPMFYVPLAQNVDYKQTT